MKMSLKIESPEIEFTTSSHISIPEIANIH